MIRGVVEADDKTNKVESLENDNVKIRGRDARNQMMQKLLRPTLHRLFHVMLSMRE